MYQGAAHPINADHSIAFQFMNPEEFVVLDLESGTYFNASNAVLIHWTKLNQEQVDIMVEGSDTERCLLADEVGIPWSGL